MSDRDPWFTSRFWKELQSALGTRLNFSTAFLPQTYGQSEIVIQVLEDMLRGYVLDFLEVGIGIFPLWNLPITTIISQVLAWLPIKLCMERNVEPLYAGQT